MIDSSSVDLSHFSMMCGLISCSVGFVLAFSFLLGVVLTTQWIVVTSVGSVILFVVSALIEGRVAKSES